MRAILTFVLEYLAVGQVFALWLAAFHHNAVLNGRRMKFAEMMRPKSVIVISIIWFPFALSLIRRWIVSGLPQWERD